MPGAAGLTAGATAENYQFFKHLALAGLIEGNYSGLAGDSNGAHAVLGENVPASKLSNAGWAVNTVNLPSGNTTQYALDYGNVFYFGAPFTWSLTGGAALSPEEAWNIDTKVDDGKPAYGNVIARYWNDACAAVNSGASVATNLDSSYKLSDTSIQCALHIRNAF